MKYLPVNLASSHPHYDKEGSTYNMGTSIAEKGKTKYLLFKVPAAAEKGILTILWVYWDPNLSYIITTNMFYYCNKAL